MITAGPVWKIRGEKFLSIKPQFLACSAHSKSHHTDYTNVAPVAPLSNLKVIKHPHFRFTTTQEKFSPQKNEQTTPTEHIHEASYAILIDT